MPLTALCAAGDNESCSAPGNGHFWVIILNLVLAGGQQAARLLGEDWYMITGARPGGGRCVR